MLTDVYLYLVCNPKERSSSFNMCEKLPETTFLNVTKTAEANTFMFWVCNATGFYCQSASQSIIQSGLSANKCRYKKIDMQSVTQATPKNISGLSKQESNRWSSAPSIGRPTTELQDLLISACVSHLAQVLLSEKRPACNPSLN